MIRKKTNRAEYEQALFVSVFQSLLGPVLIDNDDDYCYMN